MTELIRRKNTGEAWETVVDDGGGGGGSSPNSQEVFRAFLAALQQGADWFDNEAEGVVQGDHELEVGTAASLVIVEAGGALVALDGGTSQSFFCFFDAETDITDLFAAPDPTEDRPDRVIVQVTDADAGTYEIQVLEGTPAGPPAPEPDNSISLCIVTVPAADPDPADWTYDDQRTIISLVAEDAGPLPTFEVLVGNTVDIPDGETFSLTWDTKTSGADLLDLTSPDTPTMVEAGLYSITVNFGPNEAMTPGGFYFAQLAAIGTSGYATSSVASADNQFPAVSITIISYMLAGEGPSASIQSHDGGDIAYLLDSASVWKLS